jgi:hypothetical protein
MSTSNRNFNDRLEGWQYFIFKVVLFIFFLATAYRFIDHDLRVTERVYTFMGW